MLNLITDHLDVWASAELPAKSGGRGRAASNGKSPHGIQKLRELILELAVRGKLVAQDTDDEPASVLLKRISTEREKLQKEGKIKKQKPLSPIRNEEKPFGLPNGWEWCRLKDVCVLENGDRSKNYPNKSLLVESGVPFVNAGHLQNGRIDKDEMTFITEERFELLNAGKFVDGDILFCLRGSLGKSAIVEGFENGAIASSLVIVRLFGDLERYYFHHYFDSPFSYQLIRKYDNGTAQPNLSAADLAKFLVPIPPIAEQHRIVAKVDELMALCDQLEQEQADNNSNAHQTLVETLLATLTQAKGDGGFTAAWQRITAHFDTLFTTEQSIDQLKQTLLQLAVMGKLVPQDPNDEPASELLKKIAAEKSRLIKEKKIKKQEPLPQISDEEIPYTPPSGWVFVRLGIITNRIGSGSTPRGGETAYTEDGIIFLRSQNVWNDGLRLDDVAFIPPETHEKMANTKVFPDDILLNITGASLGRSTIFPDDAGEANVSQHVTIIRPSNKDTKRYLHYCILSPYTQKLVWGRQVGMAREGLSKKVLELFEIPLPPLAEQHRIVAKVDELMAICDALKTRLNEAQITKVQLADAIVEQVLV